MVRTGAHSDYTRGTGDQTYYKIRHILSGDGSCGGVYRESPVPGVRERTGGAIGVKGRATAETPWLRAPWACYSDLETHRGVLEPES